VRGSDVIYRDGEYVVISVGKQGPPGPGVGDATSNQKGSIALAGDLGGTATSPQVVGTHLATPLPVAQGGTGSSTAAAARLALGTEAAVTSGTTSQYYRGDKSWQTLDKTAVGLGNVPNTGDSSGQPHRNTDRLDDL
jgi:hypothetical protein